jgi:hypothetical protein
VAQFGKGGEILGRISVDVSGNITVYSGSSGETVIGSSEYSKQAINALIDKAFSVETTQPVKAVASEKMTDEAFIENVNKELEKKGWNIDGRLLVLSNDENFMVDYIDEFISKLKKLIKDEIEILETQEKIREQIDFDGEVYNRTYKVYKSIVSSNTSSSTFSLSQDFKHKNFDLFSEKIKEFDQKIHELFIKDFYELLIESLNKEMNYAMGFAIAGYGDEDVYPSVYHISLSGVIDNQVRYRIKNDYVVDNISTRWIEVLAQDDVIETYIDGISPKIKRSIVENFVSSMMNKIEDEDIDFLAQKQKRLIMEKIIDASIDFETKLNAQVKNNWAPIFQSISASPMLDLISFAENMVNLTSLKRKFALDDNNMTVGGPVDVAYITKFDGFSWVKQKGKTQE